jgi:hypothetical protein
MSSTDRSIAFTWDWYRSFLDRLVDRDVRFVGFDGGIGPGQILLRHDVDYSPIKARRMGQIEADRGVRSTYFFHLTGPFYNPLRDDTREVMNELAGLGHAVGVHFSTHQYWDGEPSAGALTEAVDRERDILDGFVDGTTAAVSFHNPPDWLLDRSFDAFENAYAPPYLSESTYVADSNQRWRAAGEHPVERGLGDGAQVLVHPFLWGDRDGSTVDRIREERDRVLATLEGYTEEMNREWHGAYGLDSYRP